MSSADASRRRPLAGGLRTDEGEGLIWKADGVNRLFTNGRWVEIAREPGTLTDEERAEIEAAMSTPDVNPAGNPYKTRDR